MEPPTFLEFYYNKDWQDVKRRQLSFEKEPGFLCQYKKLPKSLNFSGAKFTMLLFFSFAEGKRTLHSIYKALIARG